jgi:putative endonuclease
MMTNRTRRLDIGVTNGLRRRVNEHKHRLVPGFTSKDFLERLVYFEDTDDVGAAVAREKELKGWRRSKKIALIQKVNPQWSDLSRELDRQGRGEPGQIPFGSLRASAHSRRSLTHTAPTPPRFVRLCENSRKP